MPKKVLFSSKNCKNRQTLGDMFPELLASDGWGLRLQTPTPVILHCKFSSLHLPTKNRSFGIIQNTLFSCNYNGNAPGFWHRKIMLHFI